MAIALTYDDGPDPVWTSRLLHELNRLDAKATFFVMAGRAVDHPDEIRAMVRAGHEVGFHCLRHRRHSELTEEEIAADTDTGLAMLSSLNIHPTLWRAPWGIVTAATRRVAADRGLKICGWTIDTHDWRGDRSRQMLDRIELIGSPAPGDVVLMHDGIGPGALRRDCEQTVKLTASLLSLASRENLKMTTLSAQPPAETLVAR